MDSFLFFLFSVLIIISVKVSGKLFCVFVILKKCVKWYVSVKKALLCQFIFKKCKISRVCKVAFAMIWAERSLDMAAEHETNTMLA